jgi:hypothetical protein
MIKILYAASFIFAFISAGKADIPSKNLICPAGLTAMFYHTESNTVVMCCPAGSTLNSKLWCIGACYSDKDCTTEGQICDRSTSHCVPSCQTNSDCNTGQVCNSLTHLCVNPCRSNNDCSKNQICSSQLCVNVGPNPVSPSSCNSNKDCIRGQICSASHTCVASKETSK